MKASLFTLLLLALSFGSALAAGPEVTRFRDFVRIKSERSDLYLRYDSILSVELIAIPGEDGTQTGRVVIRTTVLTDGRSQMHIYILPTLEEGSAFAADLVRN